MKTLVSLLVAGLSIIFWISPSFADDGFFPNTEGGITTTMDRNLGRKGVADDSVRVLPPGDTQNHSTTLTGREGVADDSIRVLPPGDAPNNSTTSTSREGVADDSVHVLPPGDANLGNEKQEMPSWMYQWYSQIHHDKK